MLPRITNMQVVPVAGYDSFLLNLSGGHAPWFVRCVVILEDSAGNRGVGEIPSSEGILKGLEQCRPLVVDSNINDIKKTLSGVNQALARNGREERGRQTFDLRVAVHVITGIESALYDLFGQ
ncbi:MAG TPA: glucarate dehydratase, partial [Modicisalibacter sp.]|nr:glucarate dehydratase [Modicisalibacter sp.]